MSWNGVKKQSNIENIKSWCEEMGIKRYTINSKGEIDVDGYVNLREKDFKKLPYKFGKITGPEGIFNMYDCKNLISLKNCPNRVEGFFSCNRNKNLKSLEGCPKTVLLSFWCRECGKFFNEKYIRSMCPNLKGLIINK